MIIECPKCNIPFETQGKWGQKKFCSRKCANSRNWTEEDKKKKSEAIKSSYLYENVLKSLLENGERGRETMKKRGYIRPGKSTTNFSLQVCPICENEFTPKYVKKYCSIPCFRIANKNRNNTPEAKARFARYRKKGGVR